MIKGGDIMELSFNHSTFEELDLSSLMDLNGGGWLTKAVGVASSVVGVGVAAAGVPAIASSCAILGAIATVPALPALGLAAAVAGVGVAIFG